MARLQRIGLVSVLAIIFILAYLAVDISRDPSGQAHNNYINDQSQDQETLGKLSSWSLVTLFTLGLLIVAAIQAGLFIEQLRLIRISSNDTAKAANAARDSADAARAGLELTKDVAKRQLRAYVHVTETRIFWKNGAYVLVARFRNSGQTPAYKYVLKLGLAADVYPFDTQRITKMFDEAEVFASQQSLPAGAFTENVQRFSLDQNATEAILPGKCA